MPSKPTEDLAKYVAFAWERQLDPGDREVLYAYRANLCECEEHEAYFARECAAVRGSIDFSELLDDAGDDPRARAYIFMDAELSAYPYYLESKGGLLSDV